MYPTNKSVLQLVSLLKAHGIKRYVISAGSRHKQIEIALGCDPFFEIYSVVDERSASFFALGLIQKYDEPVGILCTSGTASSNYCSAISEAYYQHLPLLVITADKPPRIQDQQEDQMIHQIGQYANIAKFTTNLPEINSLLDEWHLNRLINEALLELDHHGKGPVHINIPIASYEDTFATQELPKCRVINRYDYASNLQLLADYLHDKKILVVLGEGQPMTTEQSNILDKFVKKFDCILMADKMSNCHHDNILENSLPLLLALSNADLEELRPDLIITCRANYSFNDAFKGFVRKCGGEIEHWYVSPSGKVVDPFKSLTKVFEMKEFDFIDRMVNATNSITASFDYSETWKIISSSIEEPKFDFCHITAVGNLLKSIPQNSCVQLANSHTVRMAQFFKIDPSVKVFCNRGTDGIDGSMSTAVGFAAPSNQLVYLLIGDLSFFYDMNALWNVHINKNMRIMMVNNGGGSILTVPNCNYPEGSQVPAYIKARHKATAKAWVEDRGFKYYSASDMIELEQGISALADIDSDVPVFLEVFTDNDIDYKFVSTYFSSINRTTLNEKIKNRAAGLSKRMMNLLTKLLK